MSKREDLAKLERWLKRKPDESTVLRVSARSLGQQITVREMVAETESKDPEGLAVGIYEDCEDWADSKEKEVRFLLEWLADNRPVATKELVMHPLNSDGIPSFDGSLEGILASQAATLLQKDQMIINMTKTMVDIVVRVSESIQVGVDRTHIREQENFQLREALLEAASGDDEFKREMFAFFKNILPAMIPKPQQGT